MSANTDIEWCHHTFNPWWGCTKVSQACKNCYAEAWAKRTGHDIWGDDKPRRFFGEKHWKEPQKWNRDAAALGVERRVFCASMADVFEMRSDLVASRQKLWRLVEETTNLNWMLLTKRPENIRPLIPALWDEPGNWPLNAWLGATFDDAGPARLEHLIRFTEAVKFVSVEPLIGPVDLSPWIRELDLVIVGAESGSKARPMNEDWVRDLRDQAIANGVAFFYKQRLDDRGRKVSLPVLDGRQWAEMPS